MSLGPRLDLRQSQSLVMTVQLQQAIKLLALTNVELEAFINAEMEKNPLLDGGTDEVVASAPAGAAELVGTDELIASGDGQADAPLDVDYAAETFHHDGPTDAAGEGPSFDGSAGGASSGSGEGINFDAVADAEASLAEVLDEQAAAAFADPVERLIARHLIDQIDDAGYLVADAVADVAERLDTPVARVEAVLAVIQRFEPVGCGARTLAECLVAQAREADRCDPAMMALFAHLDILARGDLATLRRLCGVDHDDLTDMIHELRGYNPKPGLKYGRSTAQTVIADVFVQRVRGGGWTVELNAATLPRVLVDRRYHASLAACPAAGGKDAAKAAKAFLSDALANANWLVRALDQRARTIVKVATELVRQQQAFFEHGVEELKPLTLRAIAEAIGMHELTVSRVTSNKYLQCERGLFELKYFFTSGIASNDGGEAASALTVKDRIARLIAAEPPAAPLSDDKLVDLLRAEGFDIARRTVTKYREALGLGSSVARRRAKLLEAAA